MAGRLKRRKSRARSRRPKGAARRKYRRSGHRHGGTSLIWTRPMGAREQYEAEKARLESRYESAKASLGRPSGSGRRRRRRRGGYGVGNLAYDAGLLFA